MNRRQYHNDFFELKLFESRCVFFKGMPEKAESSDDKSKESKESKEKASKEGVPIDTEPKKDGTPTKEEKEKSDRIAREKAAAEKVAKEKAETERIEREKKEAEERKKKELSLSEKKIKESHGGDFYKLSDLPGLENQKLKSDFHISYPEDLSKYKKPPRVIVYCHENGGQQLDGEAAKVFAEVEKMRANGDPVVLVMPSDKFNQGEPNWKDFQDPKVFGAIIKHAEQVTGQKLRDNISLSSFSGGYKAINQVLTGLQNSDDPELKEIYQGLRQIGFMDSYYGGAEDTYAKWIAEDPARVLQSYTGTPKTAENNQRLKTRIQAYLEQLGKKLEDYSNVNIETNNTPGGHGIHPDIFAAYMKYPGAAATKEQLEQTKGSIEDLKFPPRAPDAMTGSQFGEALKLCKNNDEVRQLTLEQAAKGAFSPDSIQPKFYETEVNGKKVRVPLYTNLKIGTDKDNITLTPDGVTMQAIADMFNGKLPPSALYKKTYADEKVKKMPFFTGEQLEALVNKRRAEKGLPPLPINVTDKNGKIVRNGTAMMSVDYMQAEHDMQMKWLEEHGIDPQELTVGARKTVFAPEGDPTKKITFGGGCYYIPVYNKETQKTEMMFNGKIAQGIGDRAHEPKYKDYASGGDLLGSYAEVQGERISMYDIETKPEYKDIREMIYGPDKGAPDRRYILDEESKKAVAAYREKYPNGATKQQEGTPKPPASIKEPDVLVADASKGKQPETPVVSKADVPPAKKEVIADAVPAPGKGGGIPISVDVPAPKYAKTGGEGKGGQGFQSTPTKAKTAPDEAYKPASGDTPQYVAAPKVSSAPKVEKASESKESKQQNDVFVIGDSLSDGFVPKMGLSKEPIHLHYGNRDRSMGQSSREILGVLKEKILTRECRGATLVVLGGTNDIFIPDSSTQIIENLKEIYRLAKEAGMKVVGATLPPCAYSKYSKDWAGKYKTRYPTQEDYENDLVKRWNDVNNWIRGYKAASDTQTKAQIGPDEVVDFAKVFEDPVTPGKLREEVRGKNGDGVHLADYSEMGKLFTSTVKQFQPHEDVHDMAETKPGGEEKTLPEGITIPENFRPEAEVDASDFDSNGKFDKQLYRMNPKRFPPGKTKEDVFKDIANARSKKPAGYIGMYSNQPAATRMANSLLSTVEFGSATHFTIGTDEYVGIKEWHAPHLPTQGPPHKWHPGISVFQKKKTEEAPEKESEKNPEDDVVAKVPDQNGGDKKKSV